MSKTILQHQDVQNEEAGSDAKAKREQVLLSRMRDRHYTTGQASKLLRVSLQTIIRCFDSGLVTGYRIPGSKFRRIPGENLFKFAKEHGLLDFLEISVDGNPVDVTANEVRAHAVSAISRSA